MTTIIRDPAKLFAPATVLVEHRADGSRVLRSPMALGAVPDKLGQSLERWAAEAPERTFMAEREVAGAHGVFNMSASDHFGLDERARVLVRVQGGEWKVLSGK